MTSANWFDAVNGEISDSLRLEYPLAGHYTAQHEWSNAKNKSG